MRGWRPAQSGLAGGTEGTTDGSGHFSRRQAPLFHPATRSNFPATTVPPGVPAQGSLRGWYRIAAVCRQGGPEFARRRRREELEKRSEDRRIGKELVQYV